MAFLETEGAVYKQAMDVDVGPNSDHVYLRANVKAPRMAGILIKVFAWFLESRFFGKIVLYILKRNNLIHQLVSFAKIEESPLFVPSHPLVPKAQALNRLGNDPSPLEQVQQAVQCLPLSSQSMSNGPTHETYGWTIMDYSKAYISGELTPHKVVKRFLAAVNESSKLPLPMSFFIDINEEDVLKQAWESTLRYERGKPLSTLDGVPIAVKDEIDCLPYPTTGGTKWMHKIRPCEDDASCVKSLRSCGAILVGKTNMHELGAGTSGINPHYGSARNPHDPRKVTGGSSSGSAAVVAAGLCPAALGVDGGGSVRLPASLCGVVGFKPTFGSVPHSGVLPLCWTVGMVGVLAGTVEDAFIVYAAISGQFQTKKLNDIMPKVSFPLLNSTPQVKLAKYGEWFNDCSDDIKVCCSSAVDRLQEHYGWKLLEVTIPEIEAMRLAHYVTIGSECTASLIRELEKMDMSQVGWDARVALSVYGSFSSREYLNAQRMRNRQMQIHEKIFAEADIIITPTTGVTAYPLLNDALKTGELDYINGAALVRYQIAGNFLGLPAVTIPVGYDGSGLPIGLQLIGKPWSEPLLIQAAYAVQCLCIPNYRKPEVFYDLLGER